MCVKRCLSRKPFVALCLNCVITSVLTLMPLQVTEVDSTGSPLQASFVECSGAPLQVRVNSCLALQCVKQCSQYRGFPTRMVYLYYVSCLRCTILAGNPRYVVEVKGQFLPFNLDPALSLFMNWSSHFVVFFKGKRSELTAIVIEVPPSTSSGLPASRQYFLADAVNIILNESPLENQFAAD